MKHLLAALLLAPAILLAQDNPNYDPDYNGDGCYSITDVLGLLPLFGSCVEADSPWACGDSVFFDSYWYETVLIGEQCWFAENLRTQTYANGQPIALLQPSEETSDTTGGYFVFEQDSLFACHDCLPELFSNDMGLLYNGFAVHDSRGLCPSGWHVANDFDWWYNLTVAASAAAEVPHCDYLEGCNDWWGWTQQVAPELVDEGLWTSPWFSQATNALGFNGLPGGSAISGLNFGYERVGRHGLWWSASQPDWGPDVMWTFQIWSPPANQTQLVQLLSSSAKPKTHGLSVRCLLDAPLQGCTDSSYIEFNPSAELDDGSCLTLLAPGCTDSLYVEFDPLANVDDGSCLTLVPTEFACGDSISYWGSTYATIMIGDQCWFKDNLKTTRYTDGSPIHPSSNYGAWNTAGIDSIGAYSVYYAGLAQDSVSCSNGQYQSGITEICDSTWVAEHFGYLYNWHVINSPLSLCPPSWHVPSDEEWINYELLLGMSNSETDSVMTWSRGAADSVGFKMFGNTAPEWATYAFQVTDDSNSISCIPSGLMLKNGYSLGAGSTVTYWSSSGNATSPNPEINPFPNAWMRQLDMNQPGVWRTAAPLGHGGYVRCLLDSE